MYTTDQNNRTFQQQHADMIKLVYVTQLQHHNSTQVEASVPSHMPRFHEMLRRRITSSHKLSQRVHAEIVHDEIIVHEKFFRMKY